MEISQLTRLLMMQAEGKFGSERAVDLRPEIEQVALQLHDLRTVLLEIEDEP